MTAGNPEDGQPAAPGRAARNRAVRWAAALLAVVTAACAAACAGPPSKGDVHGVTLHQSRNNVFILAREPTATMPPAQLVNNFLQALTGDQKDPTFSVAQEYLTPLARGKWNPAGSTTRIVNYSAPALAAEQSADHTAHPALTSSSAPQAAAPSPAVGAIQTVTVKGTEIAEIDPFGFFQYQSQPVSQEFKVKYLGAATGWRIDTAPGYRMVHPDAFKRAYQTYQSALPVYLPTRGVTPQMDQVYLTQATGKVDYTYDALARAVLHGRYPSQNSQLQLAAPVTVDPNGLAKVTLQAPSGGISNLSDVRRALFLTFRDASETPQLLSPTPLTGVDVTYAGCGAACQVENFGQESVGAPTAYFVCPQQGQNGTNAAIVAKQLPGLPGAPAVCPNGGKVQSVVGMSGIQLAKDSPIAVKQSSDSTNVKPTGTTVVAAVKSDGSVVVLNDKNSDQHVWYTAQVPKLVTDLEWDPVDNSLWVVDNKNLYRVQDPGGNGPSTASQESVLVPGETLVRFKPSLDGLRAVVVSGPPQGSDTTAQSLPQPAWMVTIDRVGDDVTLSTDTDFQLLAGYSQTLDPTSPALQTVTDAAWADGRTAVLLGLQAGSSTQKLYKVYLDGSQDSTMLDPDDAQPAARHIAAMTGVNAGHPSLWTFSDAPEPNNPGNTVSYFKRSGGSDSFQEIGYSPVVAITTAG